MNILFTPISLYATIEKVLDKCDYCTYILKNR